MKTRSGASYSRVQTQSSVAMDPNLETLMKGLNDQMVQLNQNLTDQLAQNNQSLREQMSHITARLDRLESRTPGGNQDTQNELDPEPEFETPVNPRRTPRQGLFQEHNPNRVYDANPRRAYHEPVYEPNPRRPTPTQLDPDDRTMKNIRLEAPTFDGILDPKIYIDWEGEMDQYFDWYEMSEDRKCKFAKLKLVHQARLYWGNVERLARQRGDVPIVTWRAMKLRLREKYLPMSYHQRLLDQWKRLTQGNKSVAEYIAKFDEFVMRCNVDESELVTLSRFRARLREEIQKELFMREVHDLEIAYQIARDAERFHRGSVFHRPEAPRHSVSSQQSG